MGIEIERKYVVRGDAWRAAATAAERLTQGYLATDPRAMVRVRLGAERGWITIKGEARGARKPEWEYEIPAADASELLALSGDRLVEKTRHTVPHGGFVWVVDELHGANAGLVLAEIEVGSDAELVDATRDLPSWIERDVTDDPRYSNLALALTPWSRWAQGPT